MDMEDIRKIGRTYTLPVLTTTLALVLAGCGKTYKQLEDGRPIFGARHTRRFEKGTGATQVTPVPPDQFEALMTNFYRSVGDPNFADHMISSGGIDSIDGVVGETSPTGNDVQAHVDNYTAGILPQKLHLVGNLVDIMDMVTLNTSRDDNQWVQAHRFEDRSMYGNIVLFDFMRQGNYRMLARGSGIQKAILDNSMTKSLDELMGNEEVMYQLAVHARDKKQTAFHYRLDEFRHADGRTVPILDFNGGGMSIKNLYLPNSIMDQLVEQEPKFSDPFYFVAVQKNGESGCSRLETGFYLVAQRLIPEYIDMYRFGAEFEVSSRAGAQDPDGNPVPLGVPNPENMIYNPDFTNTRLIQPVTNEFGRPVGMAQIDYTGSVNDVYVSHDTVTIGQPHKRALFWANFGLEALKTTLIYHCAHHADTEHIYHDSPTGGRIGQGGGPDVKSAAKAGFNPF